MRIAFTLTRPAFALLLLLPLTLSSCALFEKEKPKPKAKADKTRYTADDYLKNLALGRIILSDDGDAGTELDVIKNYNAQKKTKAERKIILVIDYDASKKNEKIIAPVTPKSFASLREILEQVDKSRKTAHDLDLFTISIAPDKKFKLPADEQKATLDNLQQDILARTGKLSFVQEIQMQLDLILFYTENNFRDAAYLTVDNVKQSLAKASENKTVNADILHNLSQRLTGIEGTLREKLPYKL